MNDYAKLLFGGCVVIFVFSIGCWLWYDWQLEPYRIEASAIQEMRQQTSDHGVSPSVPFTAETSSNLSAYPITEKSDIEVSSTPVSAVKSDNQASTDTVPSMLLSEEVSVSPFGLGAYPQLPSSWPRDVKFFPTKTIDHELMLRVEIALTNEGIDVLGSTMEHGRVYPTIANRVYVRWIDDPVFGRYISEVGGDPATAMRFEMLLESFEESSGRNFTLRDVPSDIEVVDYDEGGVDPYSYLGL